MRTPKGIMQYCKDEIVKQGAIMDYEADNPAGDADIVFGEASGKYSAMIDLLAKLKKSNPMVKLD